MNIGLTTTMLRIFTAEHWREAFRRTNENRISWIYAMCLQSTAWRIKRSARRRLDGDQCQTPLCFRVDRLEVHHLTYERIGDEDVEHDLATLCERCHRAKHPKP